MKKNNVIKTLIIFFSIILLFAVLTSICVHIHRVMVKKQEMQVQERAINNASKNGYLTEFVEKNKFCIEKDNVKYFYIINASEVSLYSCEFYVEENVSVKEGTIEITLTNFGDGKVHAFYHDTRVIVLDDGTEKVVYKMHLRVHFLYIYA